MRKAALFIFRFGLGFFILSICSLGLLLISASPLRTSAPIAGVYIREENSAFVRLWSHDFSCTLGDKLDSCTVNLQQQPLQITLTYANNSKTRDSITGCQAIYSQKSLKCQVSFDYATGNLPYIDIDSGFGLNPQQLQQLKHANFLAQISDNDWNPLLIALPIMAAVLVAMYIWLYTDQPKVINLMNSLLFGAIAFCLSWYFFIFSLVSLGFVD